MNANELRSALWTSGSEQPVRATTPHGTYLFEVAAVVQTPDGPVLSLRPIEKPFNQHA